MKKFLIPGLGIVVVAALAYVTLRPQSGEDRSGASTPEEGRGQPLAVKFFVVVIGRAKMPWKNPLGLLGGGLIEI